MGQNVGPTTQRWICLEYEYVHLCPKCSNQDCFLYQNRASTDGFWVLSFWTEPKWLCAAIPTQALQLLVTFLYLTVRVGDEIKFDPDPKCNPEDVSHGYSWDFKKHQFSPDRWCSSALFRFLSGPGPPKHLVDISVKLETIQFYPIQFLEVPKKHVEPIHRYNFEP